MTNADTAAYEQSEIAIHLIDPDPDNPRRGGDGSAAALADLVASLPAIGMTTAITLRRGEAGRYVIIDGHRRWRAACQVHAATGLFARVPALIRADATARAAGEASLAANVLRVPLDPVDEAEAFSRLVAQGADVEEIAARFALPPHRVRQRLALGRLHADIITAWRTGVIDTRTAEAYTLEPDPERQAAVFRLLGAQPNGYHSAFAVRRALTASALAGYSGLAKFIGEAAYVAAGGAVRRSLFEDDSWWDDAAAVQSAITTRIADERRRLIDEGWDADKIVVVRSRKILDRYDSENPSETPRLSAEEKAELAAAHTAHRAASDALAERLESDDEKNEAAQQIEADLEAECERLAARIAALTNPVYSRAQKQRLMALIVVLDEDQAPDAFVSCGRAPKSRPRGVKTVDVGGPAEAPAPSPARAVEEADFSAAVQAELAGELHAILSDAIETSTIDPLTWMLAMILDSSRTGGHPLFSSRPEYRENDLPPPPDTGIATGLLADLATWPDAQRAEHARRIVSRCLRRTTQPQDYRPLLDYLDLPVADHWRPTPEFFARLRRQEIEEALVESGLAVPPKLKRPALAAHAAEMLAPRGWLPKSLRNPSWTLAPANAAEEDT